MKRPGRDKTSVTLELIDDELAAYRLRLETSEDASPDYKAHMQGCIEGLETARNIVESSTT